MIKPIVKDVIFLAQKSEPATKEDAAIITDLLDTLNENKACCAGMAANMIGVQKQIIAFFMGMQMIVMVNPVIVQKSGPYPTEEACLSLMGLHKTTRYERITVEYEDEHFVRQKQAFHGWTAQIIQHEIDHCNGIVI